MSAGGDDRPASPVPGGVQAVLVPVAMPVLMAAVFRAARRRFGPTRGTQGGFSVYWAVCWVAAAARSARPPVLDAWRRPRRPAHPVLLGAALAIAPAGAVLTELLPNLGRARARTVATAIGVGVTNALAEEAFWHGPATGGGRRGYPVWSVACFTLWHLVPLAGRSRPAGPWPILGGAPLIGAAGGCAASATGSLVPGAVAHAVTDACGLRAAETLWPGAGRQGGRGGRRQARSGNRWS